MMTATHGPAANSADGEPIVDGLPATRPPADAAPTGACPPARPRVCARGIHVLVVDDDPRCTQGLARLLEDDGFEVSTASNGVEAMARMNSCPPDALITDLAMPGLDGSSLLRMTRQHFPRTLVVVISGSPHTAAPLLDGGAIAYLSKPINIDELVSVLDAGVQLRDDPLLQR